MWPFPGQVCFFTSDRDSFFVFFSILFYAYKYSL